ncbi:DUF2269 domain-containing protein [Azospirillum sp.]|uniref:DUF2269 family protein n=1 Tax=Azospirillum sp. TaxID=34012 RepID=UPI002D430319|nr:DUF2269 domain-containing protein [Azospirillum sp.]HYD67244.1 DUF2269 domain-containing protein [Azospirillum sp.]
MDTYLWVKYAHILGAVVIFGTGLGTAFQMFAAHLRGDVRGIAVVARNVVLADWLFTTPSVILQPITGVTLALLAGFPLTSGWIVVSVGLYALAGACWLPVVWLQLRMAQLARAAAEEGTPLPPAYHRMARWWFALGWPAFGALLVVFHLMLFKPDLW